MLSTYRYFETIVGEQSVFCIILLQSLYLVLIYKVLYFSSKNDKKSMSFYARNIKETIEIFIIFLKKCSSDQLLRFIFIGVQSRVIK